MDDDLDADTVDAHLDNFQTYEEYLDSQMNDDDLFYLED